MPETFDGSDLEAGREYYLHARLHDPDERVTLVRVDATGSPQTCVVRNRRGLEFVCAASELSAVHPAELYRLIRRQAS
jgi:hypothetical protein